MNKIKIKRSGDVQNLICMKRFLIFIAMVVNCVVESQRGLRWYWMLQADFLHYTEGFHHLRVIENFNCTGKTVTVLQLEEAEEEGSSSSPAGGAPGGEAT